MSEEYRIRHRYRLGCTILFGLFMTSLLARGFIPDALRSHNPLYMLITLLIVGGMAFWPVILLNNVTLRISADLSGITRSTLFRSRKMGWHEITELSRVESGYGRYTGWRYYVRGSMGKSLFIATDNTDRLPDLLSTIKRHSPDIRILQTINDSPLPFVRRPKTEPWTIGV
jgi:hypothetical protein